MVARILVIILIVTAVVMGLHFFKYRFNIGPGLPNVSQYLPSFISKPEPTPVAEMGELPSTAPIETTTQQLASLLAVPLLLDETGIASDSISLAYVQEKQPLMVVLFGTDIPATVAASVTSQLKALPVPPLIAVDHEGGSVQRLSGDGFTVLPSWQQLCSSTPTRRQALIASSAAELKQAGIDVVLGPVVDLTASGSALRSRTCAKNPETVATMSQELIAQYESAGITPMLKHFPGIGSAPVDLHTRSAKVVVTPLDTQPFESLLARTKGLPVMVSHLRVDPADPDTPCSMSYLCVGELRRAFPDVILVSDALEMNSAGFLATSSAVLRSLPERTTASIRAGVDIALFGPAVTQMEIDTVLEKLEKDLVRSGKIETPVLTQIEKMRAWRASLKQE